MLFYNILFNNYIENYQTLSVSHEVNFVYLSKSREMKSKYEVELLEAVYDFFDSIEKKAVEKILYNIEKSQLKNDSELFKKLDEYIWEFRTLHKKTAYRLLAFWDKSDNKNTLVLATHGFIKKTQKTPKKEILKATKIRVEYLNNKKKKS